MFCKTKLNTKLIVVVSVPDLEIAQVNKQKFDLAVSGLNQMEYQMGSIFNKIKHTKK